MRGEVDLQSSMFHYWLVVSRTPADHPLCPVKKLADSALSAISAELGRLYAKGGRPSIPPERLLLLADFKGEKRFKAARQRTTRPDAKLMMKGKRDRKSVV